MVSACALKRMSEKKRELAWGRGWERDRDKHTREWAGRLVGKRVSLFAMNRDCAYTQTYTALTCYGLAAVRRID